MSLRAMVELTVTFPLLMPVTRVLETNFLWLTHSRHERYSTWIRMRGCGIFEKFQTQMEQPRASTFCIIAPMLIRRYRSGTRDWRTFRFPT